MASVQKERRLQRLKARLSDASVAGLAIIFAVALAAVTTRFNLTCSLPLAGRYPITARTREVVERVAAPVQITCFIASGHPAFRPTMRLLRRLQTISKAGPGGAVSIAAVDPRRDLADARRLIDAGISPDALVFEGSGRRVVVAADTLITPPPKEPTRRQAVFTGESVCATAIERLGRNETPVLYWLTGHGEVAAKDYAPQTGYSDMAREMVHNGFVLRVLRLWETKGVPADAAALVVAAPRNAVAPEEAGWVQAYLNKGGRLLYLAPSRGQSGLEEVLSRWGILVTSFRAVDTRTLSGRDLVITTYGKHPITRGFGHTATVFLAPWCIETVDFGDSEAADRIRVTALAQTSNDGWGDTGETIPPRFDVEQDIPGPVMIAAAAERGGGASADLGFRATRVVVVGESSFASNGMLGKRLNANRDLLVNMVNWLTGIDAATLPSLGGDAALASGLDRAGWLRLLVWLAGIVPAAVLVVGLLVGIRRRSVT